MKKKKIILLTSLLFLLFLLVECSFAFSLFGDGLEYDDIYIEGFVADVTNCSSKMSNGDIDFDYMYSTSYILSNVSFSLENAEIVTYFYSNDDVIISDEVYYLSNNSTMLINSSNSLRDNSYSAYAFAHSENFTNLTHVYIEIIKDGDVVFNETRNVTIDKVDYLSEYGDAVSDSSDNDISSENNGVTYVASSNSNKFHSEYCSQVQKINGANKITFSSRDEAINAGYEPCEICYP